MHRGRDGNQREQRHQALLEGGEAAVVAHRQVFTEEIPDAGMEFPGQVHDPGEPFRCICQGGDERPAVGGIGISETQPGEVGACECIKHLWRFHGIHLRESSDGGYAAPGL